jgi:transcriptional regulator of met regulon
LRSAVRRQLKLVRENNEFACSRFIRGLRVLSDIVKRRSIRVLRAAVKLRVARFLQAFLARMLPAAKVVRGVCAGDAICRQRLTAMPLDRSYEASWSF